MDCLKLPPIADSDSIILTAVKQRASEPAWLVISSFVVFSYRSPDCRGNLGGNINKHKLIRLRSGCTRTWQPSLIV